MIKLGHRVRDNLTGLTGIATGRAEYLYGCTQISISPEELKDGLPIANTWIDEQRVEVVKPEKPKVSKDSRATSGGPQASPPGRDHPA